MFSCTAYVFLKWIRDFVFCLFSEIMGRTKKTSYTENEKKGLSQARNLGTDRLLGKIKEHADITDHKV